MIATLFNFGLLLTCSVMIYTALEDGWSFGDSAWYFFITASTIGLGDYTPDSVFGEIWLYVFVVQHSALLEEERCRSHRDG